MFCNPPVEDFLALIDGADYVITDSFHLKYYNALIDTKKCVDCGLCTKVCPRENDNDMSKPKWWYQGWADSEIREHASWH